MEIGAVAGPDLALPAAFLRGANLHLLGSGQGAIGGADYLTELPSLVEAIDNRSIEVRVRTVPMATVSEAFSTADQPGTRTVLVSDRGAQAIDLRAGR